MRNGRRTEPTVVRRIGIIGDVHTERARLAGALAFLSTQGVDRVLCTGDVPDGPGDAADVDACCELLRAANVLTVCGNHDRWLLDDELRDLTGAIRAEDLARASLLFLRSLPTSIELATRRGAALLCHGLGDDDMAELLPYDHGRALLDNAALQAVLAEHRFGHVICGHTHRPMLRVLSGVAFINAGTLLEDHEPCCAVIDFDAGELRSFAVGKDGSVTPGGVETLTPGA